MRFFLASCLGIIIIWGIAHESFAQAYSLKVGTETFALGGTSFTGYSTHFTQPHKEVKKEWWHYVNSRTIIFNKKTHLELTIPAHNNKSNTPLKFVSQLTENKGKKYSLLRAALSTDDVPSGQIKELQKQAAHLLKDFKVNYFTQLIQEKIEAKEIASKKISREMGKYLLKNSKLQLWIDKKTEGKEKFIQEITINTGEIEKLQIKLNASQKQLIGLKKELTLIK